MSKWTMTMRNEGRAYTAATIHSTRLRALQAARKSMKNFKFSWKNVELLTFTDHRVVYASDVVTWTLQEVY